jgi:hypothetical protein
VPARHLGAGVSAPTDGNEKATLVPQSPNPSKLCQPALKKPVVCSGSEQLLQVLTQHCAWVRAQVFDTIFGKPALDLGQCVTVLLGMLILVPYPCLAPRWLALSVAQHRITRDESVSRQPSDEAPGPEGNACERVVYAKNNDPAGACKAHHARECRTRVWSVVQNP